MQRGWGMQNNALVRKYSTLWELEQGKTFSKWILIGKAEDVCSKQFFCSVIFESR